MPDASLKVVEQDGWSKLVPIKKAILKIGSSSMNDIHLSGSEISAVHLQVMHSPDLPALYRVLNLGSTLEIRKNGGISAFPQYSTTEIHNGDEIKLGGYTLTFDLPQAAGQVQTSRSIEATLSFPTAVLTPDNPLEGLLTVRNLGSQKACQFQVALSGLPDDCYFIDPIPLIYPSASEEARVQLFHKMTHPEAGRQELLITVTAPSSYPGEKLLIQQSVYVTPVFKQAFDITDDLTPPEKAVASKPASTVAQVPVPVSAEPALPQEILATQAEPAADLPPSPVEVAAPAPPRSRNVTGMKIVQNQVDEFWDQ